MRVAVVNMKAVLADVVENIKKAEEYIKYAHENGAEIIVLPEFFTTGFAVCERMLPVILLSKGVDDVMAELSKKYDIAVGGSYLHYSQEKEESFNTFGLFFPSGERYYHSKDMPTGMENYCCTNGDENYVFDTPLGRIGITMCWEQIKYKTARKMAGKVDFVIAGSCWWNLALEDGPNVYKDLSRINRRMAINAPKKFAEVLGVPVVHSSHVGTYMGLSLGKDAKLCNRKIESEAIVTDGYGETIFEERKKPGCYIADIKPGCIKKNIDIPEDEEWILPIPNLIEKGFNMMSDMFRTFYETKTKPFFIENAE